MTYVIEIFGKDDRILGKKRLADTRVQACKLAKKNPGMRVAIYDPSKMFNHPIEDIEYHHNTRRMDGTLMNGYYIRQWDKNRTCRVSPVNGALLDYNKYWRYV